MRSKVLIADDDLFVTQLLTEICDSEDLDSAVVSEGDQVVERAMEQVPDLILLDLMMPGANGFEVVEQLRNEQKTCNIPVILVTAVSDRESIKRGYQLGANDYIVKPFRIAELVTRLRTHLQASAYQHLPGTARLWRLGAEEDLRRELAAQLGGSEESSLTLVLAQIPGLAQVDDATVALHLLREVAARLRVQVRVVDQVFVLPPDRMALLLPDTPALGADTLVGRLDENLTAEPNSEALRDGTINWQILDAKSASVDGLLGSPDKTS